MCGKGILVRHKNFHKRTVNDHLQFGAVLDVAYFHIDVPFRVVRVGRNNKIVFAFAAHYADILSGTSATQRNKRRVVFDRCRNVCKHQTTTAYVVDVHVSVCKAVHGCGNALVKQFGQVFVATRVQQSVASDIHLSCQVQVASPHVLSRAVTDPAEHIVLVSDRTNLRRVKVSAV